MTEQIKLPIETKNDMFGLYLYPSAKEFMEKQQDVFWTSQEIPVHKDITDYKQKMTKDQFRLVSFTLQLFVEIEQKVGEVWEKISNWFPHSEIEGACSQISAMEKSVHAFFYQKMNDELSIDPETIRHNQETIYVLKSKLNFLEQITKNMDNNKPLSLVTVAMIEQVLLFSNFAMLKSFKANGYNLIQNTLVGVDFVSSDEVIHGIFATYLYNTYMDEAKEYYSKEYYKELQDNIRRDVKILVNEIVAHEDAVINYLFENVDEINSVTANELKLFIRDRANKVLEGINLSEIKYEVNENPVGEWFYKGAGSIKMHDFFVAGTNQYRRNWKTENLSVLPFIDEGGFNTINEGN